MSREFKEPINLGNGDASMGQVYKLIKRLEHGISIHSALSQGQGHLDDGEFHCGKQDIKMVVADIATALNIKIKFVEGE
jgi:hypothetical protein